VIGYVTLGSDDLDRSRAFYDALFGEVGASRLMQLESGFTLYGTGWGKPGVAVTRPYDGRGAAPGNGNMVSLVVDSRARVDRVYARALELGSTDEGPPGVRGEEGDRAFYGAYFRVPDGHKFCVFRMGPAD
jgi:catechol 2,3-dioxygenase-like lactoylglutathione lyase family enzyme